MFKQFIGAALVYIILATAGFLFLVGGSALVYDRDIGVFLILLFVSVGLWFFGRWVSGRFRLSHAVYWVIAVTLLFLTLIMLVEWSLLEVLGGFFATAVPAVYGVIEYKKGPKPPPFTGYGHGFNPGPGFNPTHGHSPGHGFNHSHGHTPGHGHTTPHAQPFAQAGMMGTAPAAIPPQIDHQHINRLSHLYNLTTDTHTKERVSYLYGITKQIFDFAYANPADIHKTSFFMDFHLPKTVGLLEKYITISQQEIKSNNMHEAMDKISIALDQLKVVFEHSLDNLYSDIVHNISVDLDVIDSLINLEGMDSNQEGF